MGNCYQRNPTEVNCSQLWEAFSNGAKMDNNVVNISYYEAFFSMANFSSPLDQAIFWSGNMGFAAALSSDGDKFTMLEETSTGFILNGLNWCGLPYSNGTAPDFDYVNVCPFYSTGTYFGTQAIWQRCSQMFAQNAMGDINVLLQPTPLYTNGPYLAVRNTSIFYTIEYPNLDVSKVTSIRLLVLKNTTYAPDEVCGSGTLQMLSQNIAQRFNFAPTCIDDSQQLISILCDGDAKTAAAECILAVFSHQSQPAPTTSPLVIEKWALSTTVILTVAMVLIMSLVGYIYYTRSKLQSQPENTSTKYEQMTSPLLENPDIILSTNEVFVSFVSYRRF